MKVSGLYIYPIKSLGGISVDEAVLTDRGFEYDRRWMLVDETNQFLSQREIAAMAMLQVSIAQTGLTVTRKQQPDHQLHIPLTPEGPASNVTVWEDTCPALYVSQTADEWFTQTLGITCRLVYMPDDSRRLVEQPYAKNNEITSLSDGYPLLTIGQASLDDLNSRLDKPIPMDRFRPNIVFEGGTPYQEDEMHEFTINDITFFGVKPCARCVITTTNQTTGKREKEPLKTLSTYRRRDNKIYFGQNLLFDKPGKIKVGDPILIH